MYLIKALVDKIILDPSIKVAEVIPVYCSKTDIFSYCVFWAVVISLKWKSVEIESYQPYKMQ